MHTIYEIGRDFFVKKIGIFTLNGNINYGNRFQNYAAQKFLENFGYEVETIRYKRKIIDNNNSKSILEKIKQHILEENIFEYIRFKLNKIANKKNIYKEQELLETRANNFSEFSTKYIQETDYILNQTIIDDNLKKNNLDNEYITFFVGSDQVWNLDNKEFSEFYFLPFINKNKRNSLSASFGISEIPEKYKKNYTNRLNGLNNISVREESACKIIRDLTGRSSTLLLDPTFLLTQSDWGKIASKGTKNKRYILTYFLGRKTAEYKKIIENFSKNENLDVINLNDITSPDYYVIAPDQFLALIKEASFVFTDSFHGVAFSIIFRKPFMAVDRIDMNVNMNTRIISILNQFNLSNRYYRKNNIKASKWMDIDYTNANQVIENNRKIADKFVGESLDAVSGTNE